MPHDELAQRDAMVVGDMRHWLEQAVIGLNLCPFAKAVHVHGQIHYALSWAVGPDALEADLRRELHALLATDPQIRDTTLLMAPDCLESFLDFNDFLILADQLLFRMGLEGEVQIAGLHPHFQFAGTAADDIGNFTNRAPYPTLHLLREASVDRAVAAFPQADAIYEHNIATLRRLGQAGWDALEVRRSTATPLLPPLSGQRRGRIHK